MHDKITAKIAAARWGAEFDGVTIRLTAADASELFLRLIRICYFSPMMVRFLGSSLFLHRLIGRAGWLTVRAAHALHQLGR